MIKKQVWKPSALMGPLPATLVTAGNKEENNFFTVAWTGIVNTIPPITYISVRPERHSYGMILEEGAFCINLTTEDMAFAVDFAGVRSGKNLNKWQRLNLTPKFVEEITVPIIEESPLSLYCTVKEVIPLGSHHMILANVEKVIVTEDLLDDKGKLCLDQSNLLAYSHGEYFKVGEKLGTFGYSVRKKQTAPQKKNKTISKPANKTTK